ncbi:hypothetical protein J2X69_000036 [Algoriphagus sp. 4150]|nr:hypothetical protein [Algoriphagus sp. 4150]
MDLASQRVHQRFQLNKSRLAVRQYILRKRLEIKHLSSYLLLESAVVKASLKLKCVL